MKRQPTALAYIPMLELTPGNFLPLDYFGQAAQTKDAYIIADRHTAHAEAKRRAEIHVAMHALPDLRYLVIRAPHLDPQCRICRHL